jgi:hypothetical protein
MVEEIAKVAVSMPMKHKLAKLVLGTVAGFAVSGLVEKGYDAAYECIKNKKFITK